MGCSLFSGDRFADRLVSARKVVQNPGTMMSKTGLPIKVHLFGGENTGWALDTDLELTRQSLLGLGGDVQLTSLNDAEVIHCVWEYPLLNLEASRIDGKRIICHVSNDMYSIFGQPCMAKAGIVGKWVAMSKEALQFLKELKLPHGFAPYCIDTEVFKPNRGRCVATGAIRKRWKIPRDKFIISNFMRDSLGKDLLRPKEQKGAELFLEIVTFLWKLGHPIHILIAGPRRHWLRSQLREAGVPFTFVGREMDGDDNTVNILDSKTICSLYHLSSLHLITSRWEGGPRAVLEAAATKTAVASTPVGLAKDVLDPECLFDAVDQGIRLVEAHIASRKMSQTLEKHLDKIRAHHTIKSNIAYFRNIYAGIEKIPVARTVSFQNSGHRLSAHRGKESEALEQSLWEKVYFFYRKRRHSRRTFGIGLWHTYFKPPYGGGNQFMLALKNALERMGVRVFVNKYSPAIDVHICNSLWFDEKRFQEMASRYPVKMIHRIDGPVSLYRGTDRSEDDRLHGFNAKYATATVYQSAYCLKKTIELGFNPVRPLVILNSVNDEIFNAKGRSAFSRSRKIRLISSSWSDNPRKGGPFYRWLDGVLDWSRFEFTFVGRTKEHFQHIKHIPPQNSENLARLLRQHDIFIAPSKHEPCSNAIIEALACGLPVLYRNDGGNPELVRFGGLPFQGREDVLSQLDRIVNFYKSFQSVIFIKTITEVAGAYLKLARQIAA